MSARRTVLGFLVVVLGVATAGFFGALLGIADCGPDCIERGERAPVYGAIGVGVFLIAIGLAITWRQPIMFAVGAAMLAGGLVMGGGAAWSMMEGARAPIAWVTLVVGLVCAAVGAFLRFWRFR